MEGGNKEEEGLFQGAMRRLSEARESAAQSRIQSNSPQENTSVKTRSPSVTTDSGSVERIYVRAGEDYDPSPQSIIPTQTVDTSPAEPVPAEIRRCNECGYPMSATESYCPKCGSFSE